MSNLICEPFERLDRLRQPVLNLTMKHPLLNITERYIYFYSTTKKP